jgi:hypothetical protein
MTGGWVVSLRRTLLLLLAVPAVVGAQVELKRINDGIESWIEHIDRDRPFLLLDVGAGELRLQHGGAVLRRAQVLDLSAEGFAGAHQRLRSRLRRYGAVPFETIASGPFDWEHYLAREADDECALWFDGGMLVYAHDAWAPAPSPAIRLTPVDLRALFDAVDDSVEIVLLPAGWDVMQVKEED